MAINQVKFEVAAYNSGGWRSALDEDYYKRLGLTPTSPLNAADLRDAFERRFDWWVKREQQFKAGQQIAISIEVGRDAPRAKRNLEQAINTLSNPAIRAQYDKERSGHRLALWQQGDLRAAMATLKGSVSRDQFEMLVTMGVGQGLPADQVRLAVESELTRAGVLVSKEAVRPSRPARGMPDIGALPGRVVENVGGLIGSRLKGAGVAPQVHELFEKKKQERIRAEEEKKGRQQVARSLRAFSQQENEKIWSFVRPFANKWVSDNQFTQASRVKISRADDGGAILTMSGLDVHLSCHQNEDQWWYYFRYRTNRPAVGPWAELDREPSTYDELTGQFVAIMDGLLDTHKA